MPGELEVEALHVDGPGLVTHDVDPVGHPCDESSGVGATWLRLQIDVRHPLDGNVLGAVRVSTPVGALTRPGHLAVELVTHQYAFSDDVPLLRRDRLVVPSDRRQPMGRGPVRTDVHQGTAVPQVAEQIGRGERRAGIVRFVPEGPVLLSRMSYRLVDRQPEVGGIDDQVVPSGFDARSSRLLHQALGQCRQFVGPGPVPRHVLPPTSCGRGGGRHVIETVGGEYDCRIDRVGARPLLPDPGPRQVRQEGGLQRAFECGAAVVDGGGQRRTGVLQGRHHFIDGDRETVHVVLRDVHTGHDRFVGEFDLRSGQLRAAACEFARPTGSGPYSRRSEIAGRCEAPGPVHDHPYTDADLPLIESRLHREITQVQVAVAGLVHTDGGVRRGESCALRQGGVLYARKVHTPEVDIESGHHFRGHTPHSALCA